MATTIRVRYVTRPGSNVGAYRAAAAGRTCQMTTRFELHSREMVRLPAVILAARLGYAADTVRLAERRELTGRDAAAWDIPGRYVFLTGDLEPVPDIRHDTAGALIYPWAEPESRDMARMGRQQFVHGHDGYWDAMTRENCGACALEGYGASDDSGTAPYAPNHAAWARDYVHTGRVIPVEWRPAFLRELRSENTRYADCLRRDVLTWGARFSDGSDLA